jgi:hypothetical protein
MMHVQLTGDGADAPLLDVERRICASMSGGVTMVGSCPVVSHQAATIEAAAQELPTDEFRAATPAPMAVRCRAPGPLLRDRCVAGDRRRAGQQQIIRRRLG